MPFAAGKAAPRKSFNRSKLACAVLGGVRQVTDYVVEVKDVTWNNGHHGERFNLDGVVIEAAGEGVSPVGTECTLLVMPENARGGKGITVEQAKGAEYGKIAVALAACYGHPAAAYEMITDAVFDASISHPATATKPFRASPLKGKKVVFRVHPHVNAQGEQSCFYEVLPYEGAAAKAVAPSAPSEPTPAKVAETPKAPETPAAPEVPSTPALTPLQKAEADGWQKHPKSDSHYLKLVNGAWSMVTIDQLALQYA